MAYQWILFDVDNTLFDFDRSEKYALEQAFYDYEIPFSEEFVAIYHQVNKQCWKAFEEGEMDQSTLRSRRFELFLEKIGSKGDAQKMGTNYLQHLANTDFMIDGARPLLNRLLGKYKMAIVTNGLQDVQRPRVRKTKTEHYFETIIVSDEIGVSKPGRAFFEHTFEQIGQPAKSETLLVGDSLNSDIRGGNDFGIDTCWFNPGNQRNESEISPNFEIDKLSLLEAILEL
jgi:2-haloacid dehalogenase